MGNMTLDEKGLDFFGAMFYGWPDNVIITYFRKIGHLGGMNEKRHILVNLEQI